jgi:hypothetical protein
MQNKSDLEDHYQNPDPWGYQAHPDDALRKQKILEVCRRAGHELYPRLSGMLQHAEVRVSDARELGHVFARALDLGAGEGWITKDLPADERYGFEISDNAAARFPEGVMRETEPHGGYDLITASGVMYSQYDVDLFLKIIQDHATGILVLCNIADWEVSKLKRLGEPCHVEEFAYREYVERIRVYNKKSGVCWHCRDIQREINLDPDDEGQAGGDPDQHFNSCPVVKLMKQWSHR